MSRVARRWAAAALFACPTLASAHGAVKDVGAFYGGMLHPFISPAHAVALLALGLLIGQRGLKLPASSHALGLLAAGLAVGLLASLALDTVWVEVPLLAVAMLLGLAVITERRLPAWLLLGAALFVGLAIGVDSGVNDIEAGLRWKALLGTLVAATLAPACIAGFVSDLRQAWARIGVRIVGSWLTAAAMLVLTLSVVKA